MQTAIEEPFDKLKTLAEIEATFEMPPETIDPKPTPLDDEAHQIELFAITTHEIEALKAQYAGLTCDTPTEERQARTSERFLRKIQIRIDKRRLAINADHQAEIKRVNGIAKKLDAFVETIKAPITKMIGDLDAKREREAKEQAEAEAKRIEDERLAQIAQEEAQRRAAHEAEQARLKEEADKLAAARLEMEAERKRIDAMLAQERAVAAEKQRQADAEASAERDRLAAERAKLDAERKAIADAKAAAERAEFERQATIMAKADAEAKAERDRLAAIEREKLAQAERERIEAAKPDLEKVHAYGAMIRALPGPPKTESHETEAVLLRALGKLALIADELEAFTIKPKN